MTEPNRRAAAPLPAPQLLPEPRLLPAPSTDFPPCPACGVRAPRRILPPLPTQPVTVRTSSFAWVGGGGCLWWLLILFVLPFVLLGLLVWGLAMLISALTTKRVPPPRPTPLGLPGRYSQQCLACGRIVEAQ